MIRKSCKHIGYCMVNHAVTIMCADRAISGGTTTHLYYVTVNMATGKNGTKIASLQLSNNATCCQHMTLIIIKGFSTIFVNYEGPKIKSSKTMPSGQINTIPLYVSMYFEIDQGQKYEVLAGQIWLTGNHFRTSGIYIFKTVPVHIIFFQFIK